MVKSGEKWLKLEKVGKTERQRDRETETDRQTDIHLGTMEYTLCLPFRANAHNSSFRGG